MPVGLGGGEGWLACALAALRGDLSGDVAHGVVEGEAQGVDEEVDGVAGQIAVVALPSDPFQRFRQLRRRTS